MPFSQEILDWALKTRAPLIKELGLKNYESYRGNLYGPISLFKVLVTSPIDKTRQGHKGIGDDLEYIWINRLKACNNPLYWISPELCDSLKKTKLPVSLDWEFMDLPLEACSFMLPKDLFKYEDGEYIAFISYVRIPNDLEYDDEYLHLRVKNANFAIFAGTSAGHLIHFSFTTSRDYPLDLSHLHEQMYENGNLVVNHFSVFNSELNSEDKVLIEKCCHFCFSLILLMKDRPMYVEKAVLQKRVKSKASEEIKEFWSAPVIGRDYKIRVKYEPKGGTHASPRLHYVAGFYNTFHIGVGRKEIKHSWIEPYWRGSGE